MLSDRRDNDPASRFLTVEALISAGLGVLFPSWRWTTTAVPGAVGIALSLILLGLVAWRAARRRRRSP